MDLSLYIKECVLGAIASTKNPDQHSQIITLSSEPTAYNELAGNNPFGVGVVKMLQEFKGMENREIRYIDVKTDPRYSIEVTFYLWSGH